jgi:hypothetical protein
MKLTIACAALALCTAAPAAAATKADAMRWEAAYEVLNAVDAVQTAYCVHHVGGCEEANPLLGKHPSTAKIIAAKVVLGGLHFAIVDRMANRNPKAAMRVAQVSVGLQGAVVGLNMRIVFK